MREACWYSSRPRDSAATTQGQQCTCRETSARIDFDLLISNFVEKLRNVVRSTCHGPVLSFRQKVESPGLSTRRFCAFDWPKRRSTCLGLSSFWRNDHKTTQGGRVHLYRDHYGWTRPRFFLFATGARPCDRVAHHQPRGSTSAARRVVATAAGRRYQEPPAVAPATNRRAATAAAANDGGASQQGATATRPRDVAGAHPAADAPPPPPTGGGGGGPDAGPVTLRGCGATLPPCPQSRGGRWRR